MISIERFNKCPANSINKLFWLRNTLNIFELKNQIITSNNKCSLFIYKQKMKHGHCSDITRITHQGRQEKQSFDISSPFNYTKFWSFIDDEYFSELTEPKLIYANQLIHHFSTLEKSSSSTKQKKINSIEPLSQFIQKNNNSNLGLQLIIPKKTDKKSIEEEMSILFLAYNTTLRLNSLNVHRHFFDLARNPTSIGIFSKRKEVEMRLISLNEQIYELQLRQFADSISRILYNEKESIYKIIFDPTENISSIEINEKEYKELLAARDPINTPVNDLFLDKEKDILNGKGNKQSQQKKNTQNGRHNNFVKKQLTIGAFNSAYYAFCHHCKLRRPNVVNCQIKHNSSQGKATKHNDTMKIITEPKLKIMSIHQGTIVKKDKIFYIDHYDGNVRELMDNYYLYLKKTEFECNKAYCEYCLKSNYNIILGHKSKKHFVCPACLDICTCTRCFRADQLMKIVGCYLALKGDIDDLFAYLTQRNSIMLKQIDNLMILKIINISSCQLKRNMLEKKELKEKENELNETIKFKTMIEDHYRYFQKEFNLAKKEEIEMSFYNNLGEANEEMLIGKKTKRNRKNKNYNKKRKWNDDYGETSASSNENGKKIKKPTKLKRFSKM